MLWFLWSHLFGVPWTSWMLIFSYLFLSNWENLQPSFSNILSTPFFLFSYRDPQYVYWSIWLCLTGPLDSLHFSSIYFLSVPQTQSFTLSYLQVYWFFSFAGSNLPLNPSSEFLISFIVLFSSRISFWFLCRFYYFLIDSSILLIRCFLDFLHIFLCSLSIFKGGLFI